VRLGNDIVDLGLPEVRGKVSDSRFLNRVFAPSEQEWIRQHSNPFLALWLLWAAKESAFKVVKKSDPRAIFAHRRFVVHGAWVEFESLRIPVSFIFNTDYVHCVAGGEGLTETRVLIEELTPAVGPDDLSPAEMTSVHSEASAQVRVLAKKLLLTSCGLRDIQIIRPSLPSPEDGQFGPPLAMRDGVAVPGLDLSLSHDGRFVAVAAQWKKN